MFCKKCGMEVNDEYKVCPRCGTSVEDTQTIAGEAYNRTMQVCNQVVGQPNATNILVFGILALAFACSFYLSPAGIVFGILTKGRVKSFLAQGCTLSGKGKVGSILGKVGLILGIVLSVILIIYIIVAIIAAASYRAYFYY